MAEEIKSAKNVKRKTVSVQLDEDIVQELIKRKRIGDSYSDVIRRDMLKG